MTNSGTETRASWFARWRERRAHRRALRSERRLHRHMKEDFTDAARRAESDVSSKGGYFTR